MTTKMISRRQRQTRTVYLLLGAIAAASVVLVALLVTQPDNDNDNERELAQPAGDAIEDVTQTTPTTVAANRSTTTTRPARATTTTTAPPANQPRRMRPATTDAPATTAPPAPPTTEAPPAPPTTTTSEPEGYETREIHVDNRAPDGVSEDSPAYLSYSTDPYCANHGCAVPGTNMASGHVLTVNCQTHGSDMTNGRGGADGTWSTLWYGVFRDGDTVYISEVYIAMGDRGGLGLPAC